MRFYGTQKNYVLGFKYCAEMLRKYAHALTNYEINTYAWQICQFSTSDSDVEAATNAMKRVVKTETDSANRLPAFMDTYANLLYRQGKREEAIQLEEKAAYYYAQKVVR